MGIIGTIVIGFIVGVLAKFFHPGKENMGFIVTTLLGIAGSVVASYVGGALNLYPSGGVGQFIAAVIGAIVLLVIYGMVKGKSNQP
ncbi:MAG: GlsB/YeaQ/YmgE family stress response membrane protein [Candidatus Methylophosphatis roskildensis]|uniref:GlsB/YeaQ/YmgE family stress response membrane protein n=1 Tax=Candidatus Methylophosphatis roskildensis TaxID=2899263 RepID=A0A9D7E5W3_9PROT|nr:GlsB/YeaQ/YmgE family stress response membrane protein [Candidatus Methylophosphatis roskildensis]MBK7238143.1 GlsB/YeaQ/YmgE family stress response membrane protein [Sterolibacteriaceae bacterium]